MHEALGGSPAPHKLSMLVNACNLRLWEVTAEGSEIQGYPWLCIMFMASLGYMRAFLSETEREEVYIWVLDSGFLLCVILACTYFFEISLTVSLTHFCFVSLMMLMLWFRRIIKTQRKSNSYRHW